MDPEVIKSSLFTRQQLARLTNIDDSSLNYWMREALLRPVKGGGGRGSHRRFEFVQVNIALVYGQLRRFGVNIAALRSLANLLQNAVQLGASVDLHVSNYSTAARMANRLAQIRRGETVLIKPNWLSAEPAGMSITQRIDWINEERPAVDEPEMVNYFLSSETDYNSADAIMEAAEIIGPGRELEAMVYTQLVIDILSPGYSEEVSWLLGPKDGGTWDLESGSEGRFFDNIYGRTAGDFGSGIFIPLGALVRKIWGLKSSGELQRERNAQYAEKKLAAAGLTVKVTPAPDEDGWMGVEFDDPVTIEQINEVLDRRALITRTERSK